MGKYNNLIKYLKYLDNDEFGKWIGDVKNEGTFENPIQMSFVEYSEIIINLEKDIYNIVEDNPDMSLNRYNEILEKNDIDWTSESMMEVNVSELDEQCVMALLVGVVRAERFCEGTLLSFLHNGSINKWIVRLKEITDKRIR